MQLKLKRVSDCFAAMLGLLLIGPLLFGVAVLIRVFMGSPVFFIQERPGLHGKPFRMIKFRTMSNRLNRDGRLLPDAQRLTRLGYFLRKSSLDELPQMVNVLRGEMSLVGPRPLLMEYLPLYTKAQSSRHTVRPGITGWAQVNGRQALLWSQKLQLDTYYAKNWSLGFDGLILLRTVSAVLFAMGAKGRASSEEDDLEIWSTLEDEQRVWREHGISVTYRIVETDSFVVQHWLEHEGGKHPSRVIGQYARNGNGTGAVDGFAELASVWSDGQLVGCVTVSDADQESSGGLLVELFLLSKYWGMEIERTLMNLSRRIASQAGRRFLEVELDGSELIEKSWFLDDGIETDRERSVGRTVRYEEVELCE